MARKLTHDAQLLLRVSTKVREDFAEAAEAAGSNASDLLRSFMQETIRNHKKLQEAK